MSKDALPDLSGHAAREFVTVPGRPGVRFADGSPDGLSVEEATKVQMVEEPAAEVVVTSPEPVLPTPDETPAKTPRKGKEAQA